MLDREHHTTGAVFFLVFHSFLTLHCKPRKCATEAKSDNLIPDELVLSSIGLSIFYIQLRNDSQMYNGKQKNPI